MEERFVKIRFEYINAFGEIFITEREVPEDFLELDELEILNDTYKNFLANCTFAIGNDDEVVILRDKDAVVLKNK